MADSAAISLQSTPIIDFGFATITNSVLAAFVVTLLIVLLGVAVSRKASIIPGRLQVAVEGIIDFFMGQLTNAWGSEKRARKYLPLIITLFLFILISNQFSVLPFVSSVLVDGAAAFRTPTSDLTLTVTMALGIIVATHVISFLISPIGHLGNYFKFHKLLKVRSFQQLFDAFIDIFLGLLDIVGEIAKVISLSCRLFGNIFAGDVMIAVISGLAAYVVPMPFIFLSIFSGVVQAFVFSLLSIQFMAMVVRGHDTAHAHEA